MSTYNKKLNYDLHEGRIYCRTVALDCIGFGQVYLINWQLCVKEKLVFAEPMIPHKGKEILKQDCIKTIINTEHWSYVISFF